MSLFEMTEWNQTDNIVEIQIVVFFVYEQIIYIDLHWLCYTLGILLESGHFYSWDSFLNGPFSASCSFTFSLYQTNITTLRQYNIHPVSGAGIWTHNLLNVSLSQ